MTDTRRLLEKAVADRRSIGLADQAGTWVPAVLCRSEQAGVVCDAPGHHLRAGEEVRLRLDVDGTPLHFEATVLRVGVPVPDRGPHGLMLGFLSPIPDFVPAPAGGGLVAEVVLPGGGSVRLLEAPLRLLELSIRKIRFEAPASYPVVFAEGGALVLSLGSSPGETTELRGRVQAVMRGEAHVLYAVEVEEVADRDRHQRALGGIRAALGL